MNDNSSRSIKSDKNINANTRINNANKESPSSGGVMKRIFRWGENSVSNITTAMMDESSDRSNNNNNNNTSIERWETNQRMNLQVEASSRFLDNSSSKPGASRK